MKLVRTPNFEICKYTSCNEKFIHIPAASRGIYTTRIQTVWDHDCQGSCDWVSIFKQAWWCCRWYAIFW
ncbi:hypothetical protein RchiOBHm_Chr2g0138471 [Rosa chinensis]|uniref:Uncharacterized protein n=1 Tax=Rosa chinensis TaxID=74649 RepID=A0A2P6RWW9_ROSCH|nr:hypothetical protein RchiOBHm_Chr2g0138471 [Rosa chinensis]